VAKGKYFFFENIFQNIFIFLNFFAYNIFLSTNFFMEEKVRNKLFFANRDSKTARIRQTKTNLCKIGQIRQKSARNLESARNIFCPPDDFQIGQNFANLAEKTAIWQRCNGGRGEQRCQMIFLKSARSDAKICQNPPGRIDPIQQKSTRNWESFKSFSTLRVVFLGGLTLIERNLIERGKYANLESDRLDSDRKKSDRMSNSANLESDRMDSDRMESDRMSNSSKPESDRMDSDRMESDRMSNSANPESDRMDSDRMESDSMSTDVRRK
jgi:hypothetical protein